MTRPAAWDPPERIYAPVGAILRRRRKELGWGIMHAAQKLRISRVSLGYLETGKRRLSLHHFIELCERLGLDPVEVLAHVVDTIGQDHHKEESHGASVRPGRAAESSCREGAH